MGAIESFENRSEKNIIIISIKIKKGEMFYEGKT